MPHIKTLLKIPDQNVASDTLWTLSYLADAAKNDIAKLVGSMDLPIIVKRIGDPTPTIRVPAIRTVGSVCAGPNEVVAKVLEAGVLAPLQAVLINPADSRHHREVCWALSNIAVGSPTNVECMLSAGLFPKLAQIAVSHPDSAVRKEATWTLANACTYASEYQALKLVESNVLPVFAEMLRVKDTPMQAVIMLALEHMFACGAAVDVDNQIAAQFEAVGGLRTMEELQEHPNVAIYQKTVDMMRKYFNCQEVDGVPGNPVVVMEDSVPDIGDKANSHK